MKKSTKNAKVNAEAANNEKVIYASENSKVVTGRIVADAEDKKDGKYARFTVAHNFGKGMDALFTDCVMFNKNGKKDVNIPFDLLKKGTAVRVSGYCRPNNFKGKDGKMHYGEDFVVLECIPCPEKKETKEEAA